MVCTGILHSCDMQNTAKIKECSDVGKEQDIIRNPHLLQLPRTVSRALGHVIEDSQVEVPNFPTINCAHKMS